MGQTSSSSSKVKITAHDRAILDLKLQRDKIKQYQRRLITVEATEKTTARELLARGDKTRALSALRRGKYQRSMLEKMDSQLRTLEDLVSNIEFSQIQASVYHGLQQGNTVLKEIHKTLNADSVEKLLDETREEQEKQREIDELLATKMSAEEEEEVQAEMARLEREEQGVDIGGEETARVPTLPDAPTTEPVAAPQQEEEETRQKPQREQEQEQRQAMLA